MPQFAFSDEEILKEMQTNIRQELTKAQKHASEEAIEAESKRRLEAFYQIAKAIFPEDEECSP